MILRDYICLDCEAKSELLLEAAEEAFCKECGSLKVEPVLGGKLFTTIVPTYPGSKKHKAGYMHQFQNRPAEKPYVPVGGPTVSKKK